MSHGYQLKTHAAFEQQHNEPCRKLWAAVLINAVDLLDGVSHPGFSDMDRARQDARTWFLSSAYYIGSFLWVCEVLNLDPGHARKRAFNGPAKSMKIADRMDRFSRETGVGRRELAERLGCSTNTLYRIKVGETKGRFLDRLYQILWRHENRRAAP